MSSGYYSMTGTESNPRKNERSTYPHSGAPMYQQDAYGIPVRSSGSRWNPRNWGRRTIILVGLAIIVLIVVVIVAAVLGVRANAYPDYSKLNYALKDNFTGTSFFDNFDYFTGYDPTGGFVHYVDQPGSKQMNLTYASSTTAVMRVDMTETDASTGRKSVRITSKKTYNNGLFVFDVLHSPYGCGTWPALWTTDPSVWPANGEIDVMEAVNTGSTGNQMTLHSTDGCNMNVKREETGSVLNKNCYNGTDDNQGCGVQGPANTFGAALNGNDGGVYAMELRSAGIRVWFFRRASIPSTIGGPLTGSPDPSSWGTPIADFPSTGCDIGSHFKNQSIIANIDLCGQYAGKEKYYTQEGNCPGSCNDFVARNPTAFNDAYWEFNGFAVFQAS